MTELIDNKLKKYFKEKFISKDGAEWYCALDGNKPIGEVQITYFYKNNKYTIKEGSAFQTGLQRIENLYKAKNQTIPSWVKKAKEHNDPRKLTYKQQEELFLINLQQQKGTDDLIQAMLNGDMQKAMELYAKYHHTNKKVLNNRIIKQKFKKAYND